MIYADNTILITIHMRNLTIYKLENSYTKQGNIVGSISATDMRSSVQHKAKWGIRINLFIAAL